MPVLRSACAVGRPAYFNFTNVLLPDTNILLYATKPGYESLAGYIHRNLQHISVSVISKLEALGTSNLFNYQKIYLETFFASVPILPVTLEITDIAVELRQYKRMSLADAMIAATALYHGHTLVTRNVADFLHIERLDLIDPIMLN